MYLLIISWNSRKVCYKALLLWLIPSLDLVELPLPAGRRWEFEIPWESFTTHNINQNELNYAHLTGAMDKALQMTV